MSEPDLRLELVSDPRYLCGVRDLVSAAARQLGFTDPQCGQIALAVDEALANVMKHGYERRTDGRIWLGFTPLPDALRIVIEDNGRQVDPCNIRGRDLADIRPGGLGVHIIREVMDEVTYECRAEGGMRLTLVKRRGAGQPPPACATQGAA